MKRLLDVSVSILVVIALFMSQSWAVTAAYADYSIDGSDDSNSFHLEGSTSNQAEPISGGQESDAGSVDSEPQDAQQVCIASTCQITDGLAGPKMDHRRAPRSLAFLFRHYR